MSYFPKAYRIFFLFILGPFMGAGHGLAEAEEPSFVWHDLGTLPIEGKGWAETKGIYDRLPATAEDVVRPAVWTFSLDTAGMRIRFVTDADVISARWTLRKSDRFSMSHMPATGVSGLDLYVRNAEEWHWLAIGRPQTPSLNESILVQGLAPQKREYMLYLPLYNGISSIEIGLPPNAIFEPAPDRYSDRKPIVFYGTSVTQGGVASRPGMAYPSIIGRTLDWPIINLGFSGNGKAEPEVADLLADLDPSVYVIDSVGNLTTQEVGQRVEPFLMTLRAKHPLTPIIIVENKHYADSRFRASRRVRTAGTNLILRELYERLIANGDQNIFYVPASHMLGADGEDTVDGTHPTDLGFLRLANGIGPVVREALEAAGYAVPTGP